MRLKYELAGDADSDKVGVRREDEVQLAMRAKCVHC